MSDNSKNTIFVQIVSFNESEIIQTIQNCVEQAQYPENLHFYIAHQQELPQTYKNNSKFKLIDILVKKNKGISAARNQIQQRYNNEKYTLQLGSYHKFVKHWDTELINMLEDLKLQGYKKPLLTTYLPSFNPKNDPSERVGLPWQINFKEFCLDETIVLSHDILNDWEKLTSPVLGRFCSSHFCFADGSFVKEVVSDPNYVNVSEEIPMSVRAFTWGYDIFHPHKVFIWYYYPANKKKQTQITNKQNTLDRYYKLLQTKFLNLDLEVYGLGPERTLEQYEKYSNISFKNKTSPTTCVCSLEKQIHECTITLSEKDFSTDPKSHSFWAVSFHNSDHFELYRQDAFKEELLNSFDKEKNTYTITRKFQSNQEPIYYSIWPNSFPNKWEERIVKPLTF